MSNFRSDDDQCFVETHNENITNLISASSPRVERTLFQDFTDNHNKTMIKVDIDQQEPTTDVKVVIEARGRRNPIVIPIATNGQVAFQVENVRRVVLVAERTTGTDQFIASLDIQKTFCICCPNDDDTAGVGDRDCGCGEKNHSRCGRCRESVYRSYE